MKYLILFILISCQAKKNEEAELKPAQSSDCICPEIYSPQCGEDGKTYGNKCEAQCAGVKVAKMGSCEDEQ